MKYQVQISKIVEEAMLRKPKGRFLFLTLTVENVFGEDLNNELSRLSEAFNRLMKYRKGFKKCDWLLESNGSNEKSINGYLSSSYSRSTFCQSNIL